MVLVPLFLILGLFGNFMTIVVMNGKNFRSMTSSLILTAVSISDTALIIMLPFNKKFVLANLPSDPRSVSLMSCKLFFWFWRTAKMTSSWLIVLISIERFAAVWFPLKAQIINSKKNIIAGIIGIYVGIGSFNIGWGVIADVLDGSCKPNVAYGEENVAAARAMIVAGTLIYAIIPACVVLFLNILIIFQLIIQKRRRAYLSDAPVNDQLTKTTAMLLTVSIAFIVLVVPISIAHCFTLLHLNESIFSSANPTVVIFREVAQTLEQLNYSINFFLYVLSSAKFRKQVRKLLCGFYMERNSSGRISFSTKSTKAVSIENKPGKEDKLTGKHSKEDKSVLEKTPSTKEREKGVENIATISGHQLDK